MDDVIINSEARTEAKPQPVKAPVKKVNVQKPKKKRSFFVYLLDLVQKTLIAALLLGINFVLFCGAGSFNMFEAPFVPAGEVLTILIGIVFVCFAFVFLFSFSKFLQNLFLATVAAAVFLATLNQFALFDQGAVLYGWAKAYAGNDVSYFAEYSHYILAALVALFTFVFCTTAKKSTVSYFIGILLIVFAGIVFDNHIERNKNRDFRVVFENPADAPKGKGKKFVYIAMPNLGSYSYLQSVAKDNPRAEKALSAMLGFYNDNGFTMYTNAMVADKDAVKNLTATLNPARSENVDKLELKKPWIFGNWDFSRINAGRTYLKENQIFDVLARSGYEISAYQSRGLELCMKNNGPAVHHCLEKNNFPLNLSGSKLSKADKTLALTGEWLESTELAKGSSMLYSVLDTVMNVDNVPLVGTSYDKLYVVDSYKVLSQAAKDIAKAKTDAAYFIYMDLPSDMYVYDEFCRIKPMNLWTRKDDLDFGPAAPLTKKRDAYFDQLACAYGSLQSFVDDLQKSGQAKNVVLIVQGLSGLNDNVTTVAAENLQNRQSVSMAVRDPLRQGFGIKKEICTAPEIFQRYLFKKGECQPEKALGVHAEVYKNLVKALDGYKITKEDIAKASEKFKLWYKDWKKAQEALNPKGLSKVQPKTGDSPKVLPASKPKAGVQAKNAAIKADVQPEEKNTPKTKELTKAKPADTTEKALSENAAAAATVEKEKAISAELKASDKPVAAEKEEASGDSATTAARSEKEPVVSEKASEISPENTSIEKTTEKSSVPSADSEKKAEEKLLGQDKAAETVQSVLPEKEAESDMKSGISGDAGELGDELGLGEDLTVPAADIKQEESEGMRIISKEEAEALIKGESAGTLIQIDNAENSVMVSDVGAEEQKSKEDNRPEEEKTAEAGVKAKNSDTAGK
ncbi:MAG: hypothetical protein SO314_03695 [Alphaproteobacteria bacterium]|nr:hypothetical protein [Alphaproteobacteria bacterium]